MNGEEIHPKSSVYLTLSRNITLESSNSNRILSIEKIYKPN